MAEAVEFKIPRGANETVLELQLEFRSMYFSLLRDLLRLIPWETALEGKGTQESWLFLSTTSSEGTRMHNNGVFLTELRHEKEVLMTEAGTGYVEMQRYWALI